MLHTKANVNKHVLSGRLEEQIENPDQICNIQWEKDTLKKRIKTCFASYTVPKKA